MLVPCSYTVLSMNGGDRCEKLYTVRLVFIVLVVTICVFTASVCGRLDTSQQWTEKWTPHVIIYVGAACFLRFKAVISSRETGFFVQISFCIEELKSHSPCTATGRSSMDGLIRCVAKMASYRHHHCHRNLSMRATGMELFQGHSFGESALESSFGHLFTEAFF